jgi:hypothetical protein
MRIPEFKNFFKQDSQIQDAAAILGKFEKRPNTVKKLKISNRMSSEHA